MDQQELNRILDSMQITTIQWIDTPVTFKFSSKWIRAVLELGMIDALWIDIGGEG